MQMSMAKEYRKCISDPPNSDGYRLRDPILVAEKKERRRQFRKACEIARMNSDKWANEVAKQPKDDQGDIWEMLKFLKSNNRWHKR